VLVRRRIGLREAIEYWAVQLAGLSAAMAVRDIIDPVRVARLQSRTRHGLSSAADGYHRRRAFTSVT
jgi:hypothetical protein